MNHIVFVRVNVDDIEVCLSNELARRCTLSSWVQVPKGLRIHAYPAVYIFPADDKSPPFRAYMGKGKVIVFYSVAEVQVFLISVGFTDDGICPQVLVRAVSTSRTLRIQRGTEVVEFTNPPQDFM